MPETVRLLVRPKRDLLVTALLSVLLVMIPLFGVLYWFGAQHNAVGAVLAAHIAVLVVSILLLVRQLSLSTIVTDAEIRGRGIFSPLVRVPLERIAAVHLVPTFVGNSHEVVTQLLVRDAEGRRLYRMRGSYWNRDDLERVADALPVPARVESEPMTRREFYAAYPGAAFWFENRPWLVAGLVAAAAVVVFGIGLAAMSIAGMPNVL